RLRQQERRGEQDLDQLAPLRLGKLVDRRDKLYPRVVDEDIQTPCGGDARRHKAPGGSGVREVGGDEARSPQSCRLRLTAFHTHIGQRYRRPSFGERARRRQANTTRRARDQRDPSFERRQCQRLSSLPWNGVQKREEMSAELLRLFDMWRVA